MLLIFFFVFLSSLSTSVFFLVIKKFQWNRHYEHKIHFWLGIEVDAKNLHAANDRQNPILYSILMISLEIHRYITSSFLNGTIKSGWRNSQKSQNIFWMISVMTFELMAHMVSLAIRDDVRRTKHFLAFNLFYIQLLTFFEKYSSQVHY